VLPPPLRHLSDTVLALAAFSRRSPYAVQATKKGGAPVTAEPRRKGKKVVVIANCSGDLGALLKDLRHALGTGGVVAANTVEIQGEPVGDLVSDLVTWDFWVCVCVRPCVCVCVFGGGSM